MHSKSRTFENRFLNGKNPRWHPSPKHLKSRPTQSRYQIVNIIGKLCQIIGVFSVNLVCKYFGHSVTKMSTTKGITKSVLFCVRCCQMSLFLLKSCNSLTNNTRWPPFWSVFTGSGFWISNPSPFEKQSGFHHSQVQISDP